MDGNFALTHLRWGAETRSTHTHGRWQCPKQFVKVEFVENLVFLQCICNVRLSSILEFGTMGFSTWQLSWPPCISRLAWRNSVDRVLFSVVTCNFHTKMSLSGHTVFVRPKYLEKKKNWTFTSWWVSIWNLSSIHHDTDGAGKEPKAKQVKLWLWPEKRGALATVAPNSTDNGRKYKSKMTARERACERLLLFPEQVNSVWRWCLCRLSTFMVFLDLPGMISS